MSGVYRTRRSSRGRVRALSVVRDTRSTDDPVSETMRGPNPEGPIPIHTTVTSVPSTCRGDGSHS